MMTQQSLPKAKLDFIRQLLDNGTKPKDVASQMETSYPTLQKYLKNSGLKPGRFWRLTESPQPGKEVLGANEKDYLGGILSEIQPGGIGLSPMQAAKRLKISHPTLINRLRDTGYELKHYWRLVPLNA